MILDENLLNRFIENKRPPEEIRDKVDIGYKIEGQSVYIVEIRPDWRNPEIKRETPIAKTTYVKSRSVWKVYWMRADLKWHPYDPAREVKALSRFLKLVDEDQYGAFWG